MDTRITIKEIAELSGVGISTVSRVLNKRPDVNDATRERVMEVIRRVGYEPNVNAKHLKQLSTESVAVIVRGRNNLFFSGLLELLQARIQETGLRFLPYYIGEEDDEVQEARTGETVAMICSGDSGVYGMAALLYELRGESREPEIEVIPGLTAACSGGALLGAPLTHDFSVISLSDRLTPWEKIEKRLECAARGDMSIVLYNPMSKGRPENLKRACDILMRHIPGDRPCGIAHSIGREGEACSFLTLKELRDAETDMFSTVFIGNAMTRMIGEKMVTPRGYRDV